jgi:hypothetical protein
MKLFLKIKLFLSKLFFCKKYDDKTLNTYRWEMNNDANDGWTKKHYRKLYHERIKKLKKLKK